jgi:tRNA(Ile)-lysidine synthase
LGVAVSGGPDSLALLLLAHAALPKRVLAATIDHGLRAESGAEAAMVAGICKTMDIPHETVAVAVEPGNLQDRAREARYAALCRSFGERRCGVFATAHHGDDQAETLLMRLNRGSGLAGLAGIRAWRALAGYDPPGEYLLVRPLLHWRREELAALVSAAGLDAVRDPSNEDEAFDRVQMRKVLAGQDWIDPLAIARSAELLQDAERAVEDAVSATYGRCVYREGEITWFHWGHAQVVEVEVVRAILKDFGADISRSAAAQLVDQLRTDGHGTLGGVMACRAWHRTDRLTKIEAWRFEREPPRSAD